MRRPSHRGASTFWRVRWIGSREQNWLWCSAAIALLAELVFCSDVGGTFATRRGYLPYHLEANLETLRILRNAIFHPAHQTTSAGSGNPPIAQLVSKLQTLQETEVSLRLAENWSFLGNREITTIALRQLNSADRPRAEHLGIDIDRQGGH